MQTDLCNYLQIGYYLDYREGTLPSTIEIEREKYSGASVECLLKSVDKILEGIFNNYYDSGNLKDIVVPISGGIDSRLLLSMLLKYKSAKDIKTFTFGVPNTYDYDLANKLAQYVGTEHISIDISTREFSLQSLLYDNSFSKNQSLLFYSTPFYHLSNIYGEDAKYLSGFFGDPTAGSKLKSNINSGDECVKRFFLDNRISDLIPCSEADLSFVQKGNWHGVSEYEMIDFFNRQTKYVAPHVVPNNNYLMPYVNESWLSFWFSLAEDFRKNCNLFHNFCAMQHSELFQLPIKNCHGLNMQSSKFNINTKRALNIATSKFSKILGIKYVDKRTNYFDLKLRLANDKKFYALFQMLVLSGLEYVEKNSTFRITKDKACLKKGKPMELIILASLGLSAFK